MLRRYDVDAADDAPLPAFAAFDAAICLRLPWLCYTCLLQSFSYTLLKMLIRQIRTRHNSHQVYVVAATPSPLRRHTLFYAPLIRTLRCC